LVRRLIAFALGCTMQTMSTAEVKAGSAMKRKV
jgi:hypothetical protein